MGEQSEQPNFVIRASIARSNDGWFPFGGVMTTPNGEYVATVRGRFPAEFFDLKTARRRGRPKNQPRKVAIHLHECMAFCEIEQTGESKTSARVRAARAMSLGGDDEKEAAKYIREHSQHQDVKSALDGFHVALIFAGDSTGDGRLAIAVRKDAIFEWTSKGLRVKGCVWICQWGSGMSEYGNVDCVIPIENAPRDAATLVAEVMNL